MTKHTPGPWNLNGFAVESKDRYIGRVDQDEANDSGENGANARLIAAAPDLLAALKAFVIFESEAHGAVGDCIHGDAGKRGDCTECALIEAANAAIAKAEGR